MNGPGGAGSMGTFQPDIIPFLIPYTLVYTKPKTQDGQKKNEVETRVRGEDENKEGVKNGFTLQPLHAHPPVPVASLLVCPFLRKEKRFN